MSAKSIDAQLEQMARELIVLSKSLECSLHLNVTKCGNGSYVGDLFKIGKTATSFDFREGDVNFEGMSENHLHELTYEERYMNGNE